MSNQFFGEYLVSKNIITIEQLTEALVGQVKSQPPICSIVFENHLLEKNQIFEAFKVQHEEKTDFVSALKKLGLWSVNLEYKVKVELFKVQSPLGEVLLKKGFTDFKVLTNMLDEYLSGVEINQPSPQINSVSDIVTQEVEPEYQHGILMELQDAFSEKKAKTIEKALNIAIDNISKDRAVSEKLIDDVHKIIGNLNDALMFFGLEKLGELLLGVKSYIPKILKKCAGMDNNSLSHEVEFIKACCEMAWDLRTSTIEFATEKHFLALGSNQSVFDISLEKLNN